MIQPDVVLAACPVCGDPTVKLDHLHKCVDELKRKAGRSSKVFVKALIAPGCHVAQILNENKEELEVWLECADGARMIRKLPPGASVYL
jgi:hypothetical protein